MYVGSLRSNCKVLVTFWLPQTFNFINVTTCHKCQRRHDTYPLSIKVFNCGELYLDIYAVSNSHRPCYFFLAVSYQWDTRYSNICIRLRAFKPVAPGWRHKIRGFVWWGKFTRKEVKLRVIYGNNKCPLHCLSKQMDSSREVRRSVLSRMGFFNCRATGT